jgi:biotin carboxyl carrier protein
MKKPSTAREPTYDDLLAIVRLIESGERFTDFRLRSGEIEVEIHRGNGVAEQSREPGSVPAEPGRKPGSVPEGHLVKSPMVGTFYRAPEPGTKPFVEVGSRVKPDTIVCIIEVMKLMNSVPAGIAGVVTHVLVENARMVEYGEPLVVIEPR